MLGGGLKVLKFGPFKPKPTKEAMLEKHRAQQAELNSLSAQRRTKNTVEHNGESASAPSSTRASARAARTPAAPPARTPASGVSWGLDAG